MRFTSRLIAAVAAVAISASAASAGPIIDNFNQYKTPLTPGTGTSGNPYSGWNLSSNAFGPAGRYAFDNTTSFTGSVFFKETGLSTSNVRGGQRETNLTVTTPGSSNPSMAALFSKASASGPDIFSYNPGNGAEGSVSFTYKFASDPLNLIGQGGFALEFLFLEAGNLPISITIVDTGTSSASATVVTPSTLPSVTTVFIPLSTFSGTADLSSIKEITLSLNPPSSFDFGLDSFSVYQIPEPASMAVFGLLTLGAGLAVARRTRKASTVAAA